MAKMASLHAEGYTDKDLEEMLVETQQRPPEQFRDKSNGE